MCEEKTVTVRLMPATIIEFENGERFLRKGRHPQSTPDETLALGERIKELEAELAEARTRPTWEDRALLLDKIEELKLHIAELEKHRAAFAKQQLEAVEQVEAAEITISRYESLLREVVCYIGIDVTSKRLKERIFAALPAAKEEKQP